jgi:hypothetical protein
LKEHPKEGDVIDLPGIRSTLMVQRTGTLDTPENYGKNVLMTYIIYANDELFSKLQDCDWKFITVEGDFSQNPHRWSDCVVGTFKGNFNGFVI